MKLTYLIAEAEALKGCEEGIEVLKECKSIKDVIEGFYDYKDFCIARKFPTKEFLMQYRDEFREAGIYVDEEITLYNPQKLVLIGNCNVSVKLTNWAVCRAYVSGNSRLRVETSGYAVIMVDALDESEVKAKIYDPSRVIVNLYGNAKSEGASRTVLKKKKTYEL